MGRKPTRNLNLPAGMRARRMRSGKVWYYLDTGGRPRKETPLGSDYALAVKKWGEMHGDKGAPHKKAITLEYVFEAWKLEELARLAPRSQKNYLDCWRVLSQFFLSSGASVPLDSIEPVHVRQFMRWRGSAKVQATREKALLSLLWNWARGAGYTAKPNPCAGIKGVKAKRNVYVEDEVLKAVWDAADVPLRDALDLAYLTGQRPADVLKVRETDIRGDILDIRQNKTGEPLRFEIAGELAALLDRIKARKAGIAGICRSYLATHEPQTPLPIMDERQTRTSKIRSLAMLVDEQGRALTRGALKYRFNTAREKAADAHPELSGDIRKFQFRDLRSKAGTDKEEREGVRAAQQQLGHASVTTTEIYLRKRRGVKVTPTK